LGYQQAGTEAWQEVVSNKHYHDADCIPTALERIADALEMTVEQMKPPTLDETEERIRRYARLGAEESYNVSTARRLAREAEAFNRTKKES
jgi:hypothetical protein